MKELQFGPLYRVKGTKFDKVGDWFCSIFNDIQMTRHVGKLYVGKLIMLLERVNNGRYAGDHYRILVCGTGECGWISGENLDEGFFELCEVGDDCC